jgi:putative FmdB family regulatory protein
MPTYQYRCKACAHEFEEIQRFAEDALVECPSCHAMALVRVIGGAGLVFKGSGFYLTDYKNKSSADPAAPPAKPKPAPDSGAGAKPSESPASPPPPPSKGGESSSPSSSGSPS